MSFVVGRGIWIRKMEASVMKSLDNQSHSSMSCYLLSYTTHIRIKVRDLDFTLITRRKKDMEQRSF